MNTVNMTRSTTTTRKDNMPSSSRGDHKEFKGILEAVLKNGSADSSEKLMLSYKRPTKMYRSSNVGKTLLEAVEELMAADKIPPELSVKILLRFDLSILKSLRTAANNKESLAFNAGLLHTYHQLHGQWTFVLKDIEFRRKYSFLNIEWLKIVAFEDRVPHPWAKKTYKKKSNKNKAKVGDPPSNV